MYESYPGGPPSPAQYGQPAAPMPQSVARAVQAMYVGAAASLIGIAVNLTTTSSLRSDIHKRSPTLSATQITDAVHVEIGLAIAGGLIAAALWIWMAQSNKAGKNWARITSTVLFGIATLSALASLAGTGALSGGGAARIYGIVVWLIGLAATILLWRRTSSDYFKSAPRY
jgi:hypothetical protein